MELYKEITSMLGGFAPARQFFVSLLKVDCKIFVRADGRVVGVRSLAAYLRFFNPYCGPLINSAHTRNLTMEIVVDFCLTLSRKIQFAFSICAAAFQLRFLQRAAVFDVLTGKTLKLKNSHASAKLGVLTFLSIVFSQACLAQDCDSQDWTQILHAEEADLLKEIEKYRIGGYDMSQLYTVGEDQPNRHLWLDPQYKDSYNPAVGSYWYDVPAYRLCVRLHGLQCGPDALLTPGKFGVNFTCLGQYHAALPQENTAPSCNSASIAPIAVGNPITLAAGEKIQSEHLMFEGLPINYVFESSKTGSTAQWQQKPDEIRLDKTIAISDKSKDFYNEESACEEGLAELKTRSPGLQGLTAEYACSTCFLKKNGQVVSALGIGTKTKINGLVQHKRQDGSLTNYYVSCAGQFQATLGSNIQQSLVRDGNDWQLISPNGKKTFNQDGKVAAIHTLAGQLTNRYNYNAQGDLISIQNEQGQLFKYNFTNGLLTTIHAPNGKLLQFNYTGNLLTKVTHPDQTTRIYHYEDTRFSNALTGITDERGIRYATWKYDAVGRAISSERADGAEKTSLSFNADGSTTVTNVFGKKTTYSFTDILGVRRVNNVTGEPTANCVGANQAYTYTPQGLVETKTDWNGSITKFAYDTFGREVTRTDAFGTADATTVQTCWHATLNQPSRIIEPTRITLFDYATTGQLKSQTVKPRPVGAVDCGSINL